MDENIFVWAVFTEIILVIYFIFKNTWVNDRRIYLIWNNPAKYRELPTYHSMVLGKYWWCWNINKIIRMHKKDKSK